MRLNTTTIMQGAVLLGAMLLTACSGGVSSGNNPINNNGSGPLQDPVLTITRTGSGSVSSSPAGINCGTTCSASFKVGTSITLTAKPATGYTFTGWIGGGCNGSTGSCTTTLNATTVVRANFAPIPVKGTQYVQLSLRSAPAAVDVPIRTGVPFPIGAVSSLAQLRLENGDGSQEIPAQFDTLATWPGGSLKAVLVQFVGNLGAAMTYRIAYGPDITRAPLPRNIAISQSSGSTFVDTGMIQFSINSQGVLNGLWRDTNADGQFAAGEQVINGGEIYLINAFDGLRYSASTNATVTLEDNGPLRAVIKVQGTLSNSNQGVHPLKYLVRYEACQGSDKVDVEMTVIDDRLESDVEHPSATLPIALKALGMRWNYVAAGATSYRFGGEAGGVHEGTVSGEHYLLQTGAFHYVNGEDQNHTFAYSGAGTGAKAPGWLSLSTGTHHASLMIRDFWQQFPMELSVDGSQLTAALFPERSITGTADTQTITPGGTVYQRPNTLYFLREGGAKTYKLRLAAHASAPDTAALHNLNDSFQRHELDLVASPDWYVGSGVWGDIGVGGTGSSSAGWDNVLLHEIYEPSIENTDGDATMYGWRDYGDRLRAGWAVEINGLRIPSFYDDTHVGSNNFFKQFLRTGEMRWFRLGDISTRHTMDIDVSHGPRQGYWATGGHPQPAGELKCTAHDTVDHESRNLHPGHAHVSGLSELYLLTGDKRALDVLSEIGNWWKFVTPYMFALPFDAKVYREAERDFAWPLYVMNEYVRVTGDSSYHREVAGQLVQYLIQWWKTPLNHIGYNPANGTVSDNVIGINDASKGTGYWTMTHMDNNAGYVATGTNPWMAGPLISNLIKFYEQDQQFASVGQASGISHAELQDMLLQAENYIVKYGYDSTNKYFVYSEVTRGYSGGDHHILYGLAYLDRLFKQKQADGTLVHPEWYDTQPLWSGLAGTRYDELRTGIEDLGSQSYGFYGYEIIYPPDYFKIMRDVTGR